MLISVSGRINSGKDTVGKIIQYLTSDMYKIDGFTFQEWLNYGKTEEQYEHKFEIKKFADKLKDIVCILLNCTREQLEDREFKEAELGEEWYKYVVMCTRPSYPLELFPVLGVFSTLEEAESFCKKSSHYFTLRESLTPRLLMQLVGTECGRQILHPNIWVNALMNEYKPVNQSALGRFSVNYPPEVDFIHNPYYDGDIESYFIYPNWIISDTRFPNELKAIKDRGGITIRIIRPDFVENTLTGEKFPVKVHRQEHESETALDNYKFDYEIQNDGTIAELIDKVEVILKQEKII